MPAADTLVHAGVRLDGEPGPVTSKNVTLVPLYHSAGLVLALAILTAKLKEYIGPVILTVRVLLYGIEVRPSVGVAKASGVRWR